MKHVFWLVCFLGKRNMAVANGLGVSSRNYGSLLTTSD